jgi:hypothetical protein
MRLTLTLTLAPTLLLVTGLHAQNAAPVQNNVPAHVSSSTAQSASDQAVKAKTAQDASRNGAPAPEQQGMILDSVVAIVNGDVLLLSDVEEEQRLESLQLLPAGENTDVRAAQHLITRTLITQQMKAQQAAPADITADQVAATVDQMRKSLPGCAAAHCETDAGWARFLSARGLTPEEVNDRWRERLVILAYLNLRFQSGIRIPRADIQNYYETNLVPEFKKKNQTPPPLKTLSSRIQDILLQQQVSKQIDDWEQTLRQQGSVQILVPAYGPSTGGDDDSSTGSES